LTQGLTKAEETKSARNLPNLSFWDCFPELESLRTNVMTGLASNPKRIASKFLYDQQGSELFEKICQQPEYYQTNAEMDILTTHAKEIMEVSQKQTLGNKNLLIEFGSGNSRKIRTLLSHAGKGTTYVPIDISAEYLLNHAELVAREFPHVQVVAVCADFLQPLPLPFFDDSFSARTLFFPGSTLGNFEWMTQDRILTNAASLVRHGGSLLIGTDRKKDRATLEVAYNDAAGVTAQFEMNLLTRINRELNAKFNLDKFFYRGFYNSDEGRIEMYLMSRLDQVVEVDGVAFVFAEAEPIHVENSYKYDDLTIATLAGRLTLKVAERWLDSSQFFQINRLIV